MNISTRKLAQLITRQAIKTGNSMPWPAVQPMYDKEERTEGVELVKGKPIRECWRPSGSGKPALRS